MTECEPTLLPPIESVVTVTLPKKESITLARGYKKIFYVIKILFLNASNFQPVPFGLVICKYCKGVRSACGSYAPSSCETTLDMCRICGKGRHHTAIYAKEELLHRHPELNLNLQQESTTAKQNAVQGLC